MSRLHAISARSAVLVMLVCCFSGSAHAQSISMGDYYPLSNGQSYRYADVISGDSIGVTVANHGTSQGSSVFRVTSSNGDHVDYSNDSKGLRIHGRRDNDLTMSLSPAAVMADQSTRIGASYSTTPSFIYPATGNKLIWQTNIMGFENVTVPGGTFTDCLKVELTVRDVTLRTRYARLHVYFAKNVGPVKQMGEFFGIYFARELTNRN